MARRYIDRRDVSPGPIVREFGRFLLVGAINTALTYAVYLLLLRAVGYLAAYSIAYVIGIVVSYFAVSRYVFRTRTTLAGFVKYPLVYVAQYLLGALVLWICVEWLGIRRELALLFSIAATVPVTFAVSRLLLAARPRYGGS